MKALKLDSSYRPLEVIDAIEALVLCIVGKAKAIENYGRKITSTTQTFELPAVIVLKRYVKYRFKRCKANRRNVFWRDHYRCQYCSERFSNVDLTLDHVIPKSRGGLNTWQNLVTACKRCNQKKGDRTSIESNMFPAKKPHMPNLSILINLSETQISELWNNYLWDFKQTE